MKPLDPRLVRRSRSARWFLAAGAALAVAQTAAIIAFAWALASLVAGLIDGMRMPQAWPLLVTLVAAASARAAAAWLWDVVGSAGAMRVKAELRAELLVALEARPGGVPGFPTARIATLLGPGLDALDEYFGRYLPQLVLTAIATPLCVVAAWIADPLSGLVLVIVLPLIPVFMALIGMATATVQRRQWDSLAALSRGFLEVVGGLSTLTVFGRAERQVARIREVTDDYRRGTMKVLRITFLSGFTLELAASLSVALVAVSIGLRLVAGDLTLAPGLFVLVLAPEVFLPLRNVGAAFHASAAGVTASADAFDLLDAAERHGTTAHDETGRSVERAGATRSASRRTRADDRARSASGTRHRGAPGATRCAPRARRVRPGGAPGGGRGRHRRERVGQVEPHRRAARIRRRRRGHRPRRAPSRAGGPVVDRLGGPDSAAHAGNDRRRTSASEMRARTPPCSAAHSRPPAWSSTPSGRSDRAAADCRAARRSASRRPVRSTACSRATPGSCSSTSPGPRRTRAARPSWASGCGSSPPAAASCW